MSVAKGGTDYGDFDFYDRGGSSSCRRSGRSGITFDIARSCKLDTAAAAGDSVQQSLNNCVGDENSARQQLGSQWSKFSAASKAQCVPLEGIGGDPSYVSLLTCLQMDKWEKN